MKTYNLEDISLEHVRFSLRPASLKARADALEDKEKPDPPRAEPDMTASNSSEPYHFDHMH